jgi:O-methyltransferase involved in polyketide biosynthesis
MARALESGDSNRHRFSKEEDEKLRRLIRQYGTHDWVAISSFLPDRTPRQCRHRYRNYLANGRERTRWTVEDEGIVIAKFEEFGPRWVRIATFLPGRSGNDVKNRWHKHIAKLYGAAKAGDCAARTEAAPQSKSGLSPFLQYVLN